MSLFNKHGYGALAAGDVYMLCLYQVFRKKCWYLLGTPIELALQPALALTKCRSLRNVGTYEVLAIAVQRAWHL